MDNQNHGRRELQDGDVNCKFDLGGSLVTVIVPVFNEAATVNQIVSKVLDLPFHKEIIVVNDGSTDTTAESLSVWRGDSIVRVISHDSNQGKGAAIRTAVRASTGTYTLIQDADLEYAPEDLNSVLTPLVAGDAEVVYGSRYMHAARHPQFISHYGVKLLNLLIQLLYKVQLTDHATCYKAFHTDLLRRMDLQCTKFEFCTEVTAKACRMGICISEVPIRYTPRDYASGKKIGPLDGFRSIISLFRYRFWSEQPSPRVAPSIRFSPNLPITGNSL